MVFSANRWDLGILCLCLSSEDWHPGLLQVFEQAGLGLGKDVEWDRIVAFQLLINKR